MNGGDGRHSLHNKDILKYKGPKAEELPPKEDSKRIKTAAAAAATPSASSAHVAGRKRQRATSTSTTPVSSVGAYAPTSSSSPFDETAYQSEGKRPRRQADTNESYAHDDTDEENTYWTPKYGPLPTDTPEKSTKEHQQAPEETPDRANSDVSHSSLIFDDLHLLNLQEREYPLESAVNNLIEAAGSDTESDRSDIVDSSKNHVGVDSILQAAHIIERNFTHMHSSPPPMPATAAEAGHDIRTPPRTQAWTAVKTSHTFPNHRVKSYQQDEAPIAYGRVGYNPDAHLSNPAPTASKASKAWLLNDPRHKYKRDSS